MRIDQLLPSFGRYDAIGNDARLLKEQLEAKGFRSEIFTDLGHIPGQTRKFHEYLPFSSRFNILIHHFSIGSDLPYFLRHIDAFKVTRYHNITPYRYFPYLSSLESFFRCREGRWQLGLVREQSDCFWATSQYNAEELQQQHFKDGFVLPVLRRYDKLAQGKACPRLSALLSNSKAKTILFVGRVLPHKAQHDLIFLLSQYKRFVSPELRLILVGVGDDYYGDRLLSKLAADLKLSICRRPEKLRDFDHDILFSGPVSDAELASYYRSADVFVSLSEHEGFCVPLVEAMFFGLPIMAHKAAAIPETLGSHPGLIDKQDPVAMLDLLHQLLNCPAEREKHQQASLARAEAFTWQELQRSFDSGLQKILQSHQQHLARLGESWIQPAGQLQARPCPQ